MKLNTILTLLRKLISKKAEKKFTGEVKITIHLSQGAIGKAYLEEKGVLHEES